MTALYSLVYYDTIFHAFDHIFEIGLSHPSAKFEKVPEIVFCWNNCSGNSQEKCFKCNLIFPKLSRVK